MEVYAMDTLYVINEERENQTIPPSTAISTTDLPTAMKTTYPIPDHAQSGKKRKKILTIKHTRNIPYPAARKIVEGYIKTPKSSKTTQNQRVNKEKTTKN